MKLSQVIRSIQDELELSQKEREKSGKTPLFELNAIEVELTVSITQETKGNEIIGIEVLSLGSEIAKESSNIQNITVKLSPTKNAGISKIPGMFPNKTASR